MSRRPLTAEEHAWAVAVLGDTLPPRERIAVSSRVGPGGRAFTFPGRRGTPIHLGRHHADPLRSAPGLFAHELTHVWQLAHARHRLWWLLGAGVVQLRYLLGRDVYEPGALTWDAANIEQQATLVQRWVTAGSGRPPPPRP